MSLHLIRQLVLETLHIKITHLGVEIEHPLRTDGSIQHHIHHRRVYVEHLQTNDAVIEEVIAVHPRKQNTIIAAAVKVHIAHGMRIVKRSCKCDDIVNIARNRLIRRDKSRNILHARAHRINLNVDTALSGETDRTIDQPDLASILLHRKIIDANAGKRPLRTKEQAVKRLIHEMTVRRRHLHLNMRV